MFRIRLLPIVVILLAVTFTVRLGDLAVQLVTGRTPEIKTSEAFAEDHEAAPPAKTDAKGGEEKKADRQEIPQKTGVVEETSVKGLDDPFNQQYSDEEIKVLQSLSKRREQLEQRERDMDQREKLLQAAEKKVDEKVVELAKLKTELETLLDKQQQTEEKSVAQLVKIYENMKPKDAANIFNDMEFDVLLKIISRMSERKVAPVLAAMSPERARDVSKKLAEQKALPKKQANAQ